jgi:protein-S-isoprenylcysteine O-methyltransferase Ste14
MAEGWNMANGNFNESRQLALAAAVRFVAGIALLGLLIFLCAGDIGYWNGWVFMAAFTLCILGFGIYLFASNKELLRKRLNSKEREAGQRPYALLSGIALPAIFCLAGLDFRFGWSGVPLAVVVIATVAMLGAFGMFALTLVQNSFASRTIEVQDRQTVISTGLYSVVRHPMYTAAIILFAASPLVLGSYYALIPVTVFIIGIVLRIKNEEKFLCEALEGYAAYMQKVRFRLIPLIW